MQGCIPPHEERDGLWERASRDVAMVVPDPDPDPDPVPDSDATVRWCDDLGSRISHLASLKKRPLRRAGVGTDVEQL